MSASAPVRLAGPIISQCRDPRATWPRYVSAQTTLGLLREPAGGAPCYRCLAHEPGSPPACHFVTRGGERR